MRGVILFGLSLLVCAAMASDQLPNMPYSVYRVDTLASNSWQLSGNVHDSSPLGFGVLDVQTNDTVIIFSPSSGADLYTITNIVSQSGSLLICQLKYAEAGYPKIGQPLVGFAVISRSGFLYPTTYGGPSEALQTWARNIYYHLLDDRVVGVETGKVDRAGDTMAWLTVDGTTTLKGATVFQPGDIQVITNGGSISATGQTYAKIRSDSGEVGALAFPQITTGTNGQVLIVQGTNSSNVVTVTNGTDLVLAEEISFTFGSNAIMQLVYNGSAWVEIHRCANE